MEHIEKYVEQCKKVDPKMDARCQRCGYCPTHLKRSGVELTG